METYDSGRAPRLGHLPVHSEAEPRLIRQRERPLTWLIAPSLLPPTGHGVFLRESSAAPYKPGSTEPGPKEAITHGNQVSGRSLLIHFTEACT